jgi:hypothetical protein
VAEEPERAAALAIRAWLEPGRDAAEGLRARIRYSTSLETREDETVAAAASSDEILAVVRAWLDQFLARSPRGSADR